jgi:hypothetical protein
MADDPMETTGVPYFGGLVLVDGGDIPPSTRGPNSI